MGASDEQGTQAYKVFQGSLRASEPPRASWWSLKPSAPPEWAQGFSHRSVPPRLAGLVWDNLPDSPDSRSLVPAAGLEVSGRWERGENFSLGPTWLYPLPGGHSQVPENMMTIIPDRLDSGEQPVGSTLGRRQNTCGGLQQGRDNHMMCLGQELCVPRDGRG